MLAGALFVVAMSSRAAEGQAPWHSATARELHKVVRFEKPDAPDRPARVGDMIQGVERFTTGSSGSLAELEFDDKITVARLGSETQFSIDPVTQRIKLPKGLTVLSVHNGEIFCETCALSIAQKSTAIVESFDVATKRNAPLRCATKYILLEGHATVSTPDGKRHKTLKGGQMILQLEGDPNLGPIQDVDLKQVLKESRIITGFATQLASMPKIQEVVQQQQKELWQGVLQHTGFAVAGRGRDRYLEPPPNRVDWEAPYDPDVPAAAIIDRLPDPCPTCP